MKIAIVYWSGTGNTESMADIINKKCKELGAETTMFFGAEFDASDLPNYDAVAFGCPASGDESLEESEFQPMWDAVKPKLAGKKIALFGSFSWNEGKWMETWEEDAKTTGANIVHAPVIAEERPNYACRRELEELAADLMK